MKQVLLIILCTCILLLFPAPAAAENTDLIMEAHLGFNNAYMLGIWTPVVITVENRGEEHSGTIEAEVMQSGGKSVYYGVQAVVPGNSKKEFVVFVKIQDIVKTVNIRFADKKGQILESVRIEDLKPVTPDRYFLGLVTEDQPSLGYWKDKTSESHLFSNYEPISLDASSFPDRKEVLDGFSILILNNVDTSAFNSRQIKALSDWIRDGGILIVGTGPNGRRVLRGLSGSVLPVSPGEVLPYAKLPEVEDTAERPIHGEMPFQLMMLHFEEGERILDSDDVGVVLRHVFGDGLVYTAAFDLGLEPVTGWTGSKIFWDNLLIATLPQNKVIELQNPYHRNSEQAYRMDEALGSIEAMDLPSAFVILLIFVAYLLLVGPINYIILKKLDRREWSWYTIPAISIVFAVLIYSLGYMAKGGDLVTNTITVVNTGSPETNSHVKEYVGIFTPKRGDYRVDIDRDVLISLNDQERGYVQLQDGNRNPGTVEARFFQGLPSRVEFPNLNVWTMKTFRMEYSAGDELGFIDAELYYESEHIKGTVTNMTAYPLEDFVIYTDAAYFRVGNIAVGETRNVDLEIPIMSQPFYQKGYYMMLDEMYPYHGGYSSKDRNILELTMKRRILESLTGMFEPRSVPIGNEAFKLKYFAFFDAEPAGGIKINGKTPQKTEALGVFSGNLEFELQRGGLVSIPPGLLPGRFNLEQSDGVSMERGSFYFHSPEGYAVFDFDIREYIKLIDLNVKIHTMIHYGTPGYSLYNFEKGDFDDFNIMTLDQDALSSYINDTGRITLKVRPMSYESLGMDIPSIVLEGRQPQ